MSLKHSKIILQTYLLSDLISIIETYVKPTITITDEDFNETTHTVIHNQEVITEYVLFSTQRINWTCQILKGYITITHVKNSPNMPPIVNLSLTIQPYKKGYCYAYTYNHSFCDNDRKSYNQEIHSDWSQINMEKKKGATLTLSSQSEILHKIDELKPFISSSTTSECKAFSVNDIHRDNIWLFYETTSAWDDIYFIYLQNVTEIELLYEIEIIQNYLQSNYPIMSCTILDSLS